MKRWILILLVLIPVAVFAADTAVKDMQESTSPAITDVIYLVGDPAGTPVDRKVTVGALTQIQTVVDSGSGDYSISDAQARAGTYFINTYAGTKTFILPAAAANRAVCVRNGQGNARELRIDTDGTDYIVKLTGARTSAAGDYYACTADAKNSICVVAFDATDWYVVSEAGTCAEQ